MPNESTPRASLPSHGDRAWLAALLLQRQNRLMPRFLNAFTRLSGLARGSRRRLQRLSLIHI